VKVEAFYDAIWPNSSEENRQYMLRSTISAVRRLLIAAGIWDDGNGVIKTDDGYRLDFGQIDIDYTFDVESFTTSISAARRATSAAQKEGFYREAISYYTGDYLTAVRDDEWLVFQRGRLQDMAIEAMMFIAERYAEDHRYPASSELCEKVLVIDVTYETAYELLIRNCLKRHLYTEAREVFQRCKKAFRAELDSRPPQQVEALVAEMTV
jgi:LuxR family transcriptional regulator, maltose regulon positive regulatory protein